MPVYLYWGEEEFNIDKAVRDLRKKVIDPQWAALGHKILETSDLQTIIEALETTPMMFGNLLVEIYTDTLFMRGASKIAKDDKLLKRLITTIETLNSNIYAVFVCKIPRGSGKKVDSTKKIVKTISTVGKVVEYPAFKPYEIEQITDWVKKNATSRKTNINKDAAIQLIHHAGTDLRRLDSELDKLATYIYPHKTIEVRHIKELCSSTEDIFRMTDYWITNQKASALIELNKLFEKNHPIRIVSTMQSLLKRWLRIKLELKNRSIKEVAEIVGLHPYVVEQDAKKLKNVSIEQLVKLRKNLSEAEYNIKSGKIEPEISLEMAITQ